MGPLPSAGGPFTPYSHVHGHSHMHAPVHTHTHSEGPALTRMYTCPFTLSPTITPTPTVFLRQAGWPGLRPTPGRRRCPRWGRAPPLRGSRARRPPGALLRVTARLLQAPGAPQSPRRAEPRSLRLFVMLIPFPAGASCLHNESPEPSPALASQGVGAGRREGAALCALRQGS